jgi:thioredoxin reductase (NADPH)
MNSRVKEIAENSFDETLQGTDKLVVVEFYLPTCPHCQAVAPIYEKIARELGDAAAFTRINAQNNQRVSMEEGITVTPTFKCMTAVKYDVDGYA